MSSLLQSTLLSLENNLLQLNIKQNLLSEKTAKILEVSKALICFLDFQPKVSFDKLTRSQFGVSLATKNFEQIVREDLKLVSNAQKIIAREWDIRESMQKNIGQMARAQNKIEIEDAQRNNCVEQLAEFSVKNLNYLQSELARLVRGHVGSLNFFVGECARSIRGLNLVSKCLADLENGGGFGGLLANF